MDKKVVNEINDLPENDRFIRGLRAWVGFKQIGVDYIRPERMFGRTANNFFKMLHGQRKVFFFFIFTIRIYFLFVLLNRINVICCNYVLFCILFYKSDSPKGITTIILLILFLGGIQLLFLSFISEYIAKILQETKKRPKYIIDRKINFK